jgi:hypothetical protein
VNIEEEGQPRGEFIDVEAARQRGFDISKPVCQRESQFLRRRAACLPDVIAGDTDGVPLGHSRVPNSMVSTTSRMDGSGGKRNSFWAINSFRMSF